MRAFAPRSEGKGGFTLVEILVALAILGLLAGAVTTAIYQIFSVNTQSNNAMLVIRQVQDLGQWLNRDIQTAQKITPGANDGLPLVLEWDYRGFSDGVYTGEKHRITYTYDADTGIITREDVVYDADNNIGTPQVIVAARYINAVSFEGSILEVTAAIGNQSETRTYEITVRVTQG
ncbi:type II secretion system protein [Dehalogenimonas sp. WBC-2]|nr:type II secretion system protein [Dehalogenimonas sp. WBC-2]